MEQQTAVEFLVDELIKLGYLHSKEHGQSPIVNKYIRQAKQMELKAKENTYTEEQMIDFGNWCRMHDNSHPNEVWFIQQLWSKYIQSLKQTK